MTGIDTALAPGGAFVIEAHYLLDILEQLAFDTVYHEHVSYWALGPMQRLFAQHGMEVTSAERLPIHHGQLRVFVQRVGEGAPDESVARILAEESEHELLEPQTWHGFAERVNGLKRDLHATLAALHREGKRVGGYGAPAKGSTLLSFLDLGPDDISWIADRSALKQGRLTPGSHIPIVGPERLLDERPDAVLLLAWNFADEIIEQQSEYVDGGGRFILPVPDVRFLP
jgi:C-methyltransferase C-terminal domain